MQIMDKDNYEIVSTFDQIDAYFDSLNSNPRPFSLDFETTGLDTLTCEIVGVGLSDGLKSIYIPTFNKFPMEYVRDKLNQVLIHDKNLLIVHNAKYELKILDRFSVEVANFYDTMVAAYVENSDQPKGLKKLVKERFYITMTEFTDVVPNGTSILEVGDDIVGKYCCDDAFYTYKLYESFETKWLSDQQKQVLDLDLKLLRVVIQMEQQGVHLDVDHFTKLETSIGLSIAALEKKIYEEAGKEFNISSTKQLGKLIYEDMKAVAPIYSDSHAKWKKDLEKVEGVLIKNKVDLSGVKDLIKAKDKEDKEFIKDFRKEFRDTHGRDDKGKDLLKMYESYCTKLGGKPYSTDSKVLHMLEKEVKDTKFFTYLLKYRELTKLKCTYVDAFPKLIHNQTGKVHCNFNSCGTVTGRFSSSNPNLQNLPASGLGKEIRRGIVSDSGWSILTADYSQIELRLFAHFSGDTNLISAFLKGEDAHSAVAAKMFNVDIKDVTKKQRSIGKTLNFAIVYGAGPRKIAETVEGITIEEAKDFINKYYESIPTLKGLMEDTVRKAKSCGYVETILGRRRYFKDLNSPNFKRRMAAERQCFNALLQGTAADIMRVAMLNVKDTLSNDLKLIMTVHDELVFEVEDRYVPKAKYLVERAMLEVPFYTKVPMKIEMDCAKNYGDSK